VGTLSERINNQPKKKGGVRADGVRIVLAVAAAIGVSLIRSGRPSQSEAELAEDEGLALAASL